MTLLSQLRYAAKAYEGELRKERIDKDSLRENRMMFGLSNFFFSRGMRKATKLFSGPSYYKWPVNCKTQKALRKSLDARLFLLEILIEEIKQDKKTRKNEYGLN